MGIEKLLQERYEEIFQKNHKVINTMNDVRYSKPFLPTVFPTMNLDMKIMIIGRETRGWGRSKEYQNVAIDNPVDLMEVYQKDYEEKLPKRTRGFPAFLNKIVSNTGSNPLWCNFFCTDFNKGHPKKGDRSRYKAVSELSKELLEAQIEIFQPDIIIMAYGRGIDSNRAVLKDIITKNGVNVSDTEYLLNDKTKKDFPWKQTFSNGIILYDLFYHPAARIKGLKKIREKTLKSLAVHK